MCESCGFGPECGVCGRGQGLPEALREPDPKPVVVRWYQERAIVYPEGGINFGFWQPGHGWTVEENPTRAIVRLALTARAVAFPELARLTVADVVA